VKLLFDQNLSPKLVRRLSDLFPDSRHVRDQGLSESEDAEVWAFASENRSVIVSKDSDFVQLALLLGSPPKVIRLHLGNCTTDRVESVLRTGFQEIDNFGRNPEASLLQLPAARRITSP